jgi:PAS domain S-box-containing protein
VSEILDYLFGAASFVPHGYCLLWRPDLVALHAISDFLIAASYFAIPGAIMVFTARRKDLAPDHRQVGLLFIVFIVACGVTHLGNLATLWFPYYGLLGLTKAVTATVSLTTAIVLVPLVPALLALPSREDLERKNRALAEEIASHRRTLEDLRRTKLELEDRVRERTAELAVNQRRMELALRSTAVTLFEQDEDLRYTWIFNPEFGLSADEFIGRSDDEVLPEQGRERVVAIKREALDKGEMRQAEVSLNDRDKVRWWDLRVERFAAGDGRRALICSAIDVTARKDSERHLRMLLRELTHRSKNLLAVIESIARQSAKESGSTAGFLASFGERLRSLAASNDLLVEGDWRGVRLDQLVESQLQHLSDRFDVEGPPVVLRADATQQIGMALHELATNAVKHGALSVPSGRVKLAWTLVREPSGDESFVLEWREAGGPPAEAPARRGFGSLVTGRMIERALSAAVEIEYKAEGLRWAMRAPAVRVVEGASSVAPAAA